MNLLSHRLAAFACTVAALGVLVGTYAVFVGSYPGQERDHQAMLAWSARFGHEAPSTGWLGSHQLMILAGLGAMIAAVCAARRSARLAAHAGVLILTATVTAVLLKAGLTRPSFGVGGLLNSFPSNTVAAVVAGAVAVVAVVPERLRSTTALIAAGGAIAASGAVVALQWHRPSDVLGGWLVALAAACLAEMLIPARATEPAQGPSRRRASVGRDATVVAPHMPDWRRCDSY